MSLENKLGLTSSADLAREEERISKKKALELFEKGMLDQLEAGKFSALKAIHKFFACLACFLPNFPSPLWSHIPEDDAFVYTIKWNHLRFATRTFEWIYMESPYIMALHADPTISRPLKSGLSCSKCSPFMRSCRKSWRCGDRTSSRTPKPEKTETDRT